MASPVMSYERIAHWVTQANAKPEEDAAYADLVMMLGTVWGVNAGLNRAAQECPEAKEAILALKLTLWDQETVNRKLRKN